MLENAFSVPVSVDVDCSVNDPPDEIVSVGLFVASDATANTFCIIMLQSSMFKLSVIVTFPAQVNVFVPPDASVPSYPNAASTFVRRYAQSMLVPFRETGAGSRRNSIESPTPKLPGYHRLVVSVSF